MATNAAIRNVITVVGIVAAATATPMVAAAPASADPGQNCRTEWNTMYTVPIGVRTICYNPDGSYQMCTSLGTDGKGPGTCMDYPAPPRMGGQPTFSPPVPGMPPPLPAA
ncbi:hypothetical protein [Mycobacterium shimoidei]|uniref:hypothetical protein n=1 Tax=Mycobacterium shimoidei TaxID=29313 RepID=UPI0012F4D196|nr:hypothetical protein [Mycobacterium shimoidei]MCV7260780.1 hypothetical protein [Mycobacterium shimoidei]